MEFLTDIMNWNSFKRLKNFSDYEKRSPLLIDKIKKEYKNIGRGFELLCKEFLLEKNRLEELPFKFYDLGRQWGNSKARREETYMRLTW